MLKALLSTLRNKTVNDPYSTRRSFPRRDCDRCVSVILGKTFPVENWSPGGVLIYADERLFGVNNDVELTLKFKLRNAIVDVKHQGHIIRKGNGKVAIEFEPLSKMIRNAFQQVIDDHVAREFARSQFV